MTRLLITIDEVAEHVGKTVRIADVYRTDRGYFVTGDRAGDRAYEGILERDPHAPRSFILRRPKIISPAVQPGMTSVYEGTCYIDRDTVMARKVTLPE